jgi:capsular polysaccharide biosynthesis protein
VVVGALVGFGVSFLWPAQYVGRATVLYVITQEDPTGFLREDRNLTTQQLLMQSNAVTGPVAGQYGLTAEDLQEKMTVSLADGSELLTVDVRDPSQDLATRMAAAVTNQYLQVSAATQPMADQAKFLQDQLNTVTAQVNNLTTANTPASLAQLPSVAQRQTQLAQQLDQLNLAQVARPTARLVVPAFPAGQISPRPGFGAATGAVAGLAVAIVAIAVLARRWHRARPR